VPAAKWQRTLAAASSNHSTGLSVESSQCKTATATSGATLWLGPSTEPPLLKTLRRFLSNPAVRVIHWAKHGKTFIIENQNYLQDLADGDAVTASIAAYGVLPQLKHMGFTRLYNDGTSSIWHHKLFRRLENDSTAVPKRLEAADIPSTTSTAPTQMSWGERRPSIKVSIRCAAVQADDTATVVATLPSAVPMRSFRSGAFCLAFGCVKKSQSWARSKGLCRAHFVESKETAKEDCLEDSSSDEEEHPCISRKGISMMGKSPRFMARDSNSPIPHSPPATSTSMPKVPSATQVLAGRLRVSVVCSALEDRFGQINETTQLCAVLPRPTTGSFRIVKGRRVPAASPAHQFGEGWTVEEHPRANNRDRVDKYWYSPKGLKFRSVASVRRFLDALALTGDEDEAYAVIKGLSDQAHTNPLVPASTHYASPATIADTEVNVDAVSEVGGEKVTRSQKRQINRLLSNQQQQAPITSRPSSQMQPPRKKIKTATQKGSRRKENEAPTERQQRHRHNQPDTFAPRSLGVSSDKNTLSDMHSFIRRDLIEVFCANEKDVRKSLKSARFLIIDCSFVIYYKCVPYNSFFPSAAMSTKGPERERRRESFSER